MSLGNRWISRIAGVASGLSVLVALCLGAGSPSAWAHVQASGDNTVRGGMAIVTFQVPNESNTGAPTTALTVALPNVAAARTESVPGWTAKLDRDAASGTVRSVTWTAAPNGGIGAGSVRVVPDLAATAQHRHRQLPRHPDLRRRINREMGPVASARRCRSGTSGTYAGADSGAGDTRRSPSERRRTEIIARQHRPPVGRGGPGRCRVGICLMLLRRRA